MSGVQSNNPFICETSQLHHQTQQRRTYLGKSLCRRQTLCVPVKTLAKRRWLMSNGIAEGWMETASLGKSQHCSARLDRAFTHDICIDVPAQHLLFWLFIKIRWIISPIVCVALRHEQAFGVGIRI